MVGIETQEPEPSLVSAGFAPLAELASFGNYEAEAVMQTGSNMGLFVDDLAQALTEHLMKRPESADLLIQGEAPVNAGALRYWIERTIAGPFDEGLGVTIRGMSHLEDGKATFPGLDIALPPQMLLALMSWFQGELLEALSRKYDVPTISAAGGAWMDLLMLQLGIMLEPYLTDPAGPQAEHTSAGFHPYAGFAGFGPREARILGKTGPLLEPAAGGVIALAYDYLLSRPESAGYFQDASHLAKRKMTLKGWWARSTTSTMDADFHSYLSKVADSHVQGGGEDPHLSIPADLTIALMGWVEMRVMTALNTIAPGEDGESYVFGVMGEPEDTAAIGKAWMRMLTLQLGVLMKPYFAGPAAA
ncbi:MAG: protoglobin domain-containing protein [Actinomycetota bacterium]